MAFLHCLVYVTILSISSFFYRISIVRQNLLVHYLHSRYTSSIDSRYLYRFGYMQTQEEICVKAFFGVLPSSLYPTFFFLGFSVASISNEAMTEELIHAADISLLECHRSILSLLDNAKELSYLVASSFETQYHLQGLKTISEQKEHIVALENILRTNPLYQMKGGRVRIVVPSQLSSRLLSDMVLSCTDPNVADAIEVASEHPQQFFWSLYSEEHSIYLRQSKAIYSTENWQDIIGYILVDIYLENLRGIAVQAEQTGNRLYLVQSSGEILYPHFNYDKIPSEILQAQNLKRASFEGNTVLIQSIAGTEWKLLKVIPLHTIKLKTESVKQTIRLIGLVFACLSALSAFYFFDRISQPISQLGSKMKNVQAGSLSTISLRNHRGEILELYESYNFMIRHLEQQIQQTYIAELQAKSAELRALQAQINPHFLYNTLDSINWLAFRYDAYDIQEIVIALSDMLRLSLNKGEIMISVEDELKQVDSYITLQKIRFSDSFDVSYEIDESVLSCKIVKMLLQPLVENAIIHGFEDFSSGGLITIRIRDLDNYLFIEVLNNGKTIDLEQLQQAVIDEDENRTFRGYGIKNVNQRLASYYSANYKVKYFVRDSNTVAQIIIPREVEDDVQSSCSR